MGNTCTSNQIIEKFPYLCSNIPSSPELICYVRPSTNYSDFLKRHKYLRNRLLVPRNEEMRLKRSLSKCFFGYQSLVEKHSVSSKIMSNIFFYFFFCSLCWCDHWFTNCITSMQMLCNQHCYIHAAMEEGGLARCKT